MQSKQTLLNDKEISQRLSMSLSWVRQQRWKRRQGQDHVFGVDPVMLGASPRYRQSEVTQWMESLGCVQ